ncbi:MAG: two-component system NtrC family sensor histidine kinase [Gallionellaceae bacterium]|nr:MAG: two-component system NtrC family sensor histidine kinase [Gallionellaceae bacterium]
MAIEDLWRSLYFFGLYRLILGGLLLLLATAFGEALSLNAFEQTWVFRICLAYIFLTLVSLIGVQIKRPPFSLLLAFQVGTDIVVIATLTYFNGGIQSNLGMLLLVSLAAAGMISRGRITLFYAALASIAILLEHAYSVLTHEAAVGQFLQAGILSAAYFAVAWLSHTLSKYAIASEKLAFVRGVDLSNMAEANRLMIQDIPDGVLVVDERGAVRQSNPSAERLLGHVFLTDNPCVLGECSPLLDALFAAWRQNKALGHEVLRLPTTNRLVRVRFLPVQREGFWGAVIVLEDMQRVQEQAQQVKLAALGRLTANIAHEVRNPLSSISYAAELLQEGRQDPAQLRLSQIILDNAARLNRIVQDVMQLNRRDRVHAEPIDLAQKLANFAEELCQTQHLLPELVRIVVSSECRVSFDRGHLDQVLWNLGNNALRYSQKMPGSIKLLARYSDDGNVVLEVIDDGPGIDAETAQKLFEPFFTTDARGTGLGLYIARELCEANGAVLEYSAPNEGGACFRIVFGVNNEP